MKKLIFCWLLSVLFLSTTDAQNRTVRTGYEGDFFSLEGTLDLFKQSYTLRDFERKLNTKENWVNNLDLDYDGRIDYIRVEHRRQGNFHAIILQALVDRNDVQDVAVIEIEIIGRGEAILQIVGDEYLYGEEVIVEPAEGYSDSRSGYQLGYGDYVNVYYWEPVQYVLGRQYVAYVSPYRWQYYPAWWSPWAQFTWSVFRPRIVIYHRYYHVVHIHRVVRVHHFYRPYRSCSYTVVQRTNKVRVKHGKPPIHHATPAVQQNRRPDSYRSRNDFVAQPGTTTRSSTPERSPSVSRKATPASGQKAAPQIKQPARSTTTRSSTKARSTAPARKPSASSRTAPPAKPKAKGNTPSRVHQQSRSTTTRSSTKARSTAPARKPAASSRTAPPAKPKAKGNTPSRVHQQSRSTTTRSSTKARSTAPARKPAASSRTAPPAKSKAKGNKTSRGHQ